MSRGGAAQKDKRPRALKQKHLKGAEVGVVLVDASESCPVHSERRHLLQKAELHEYVCTCAWDTCTAAQLAAAT